VSRLIKIHLVGQFHLHSLQLHKQLELVYLMEIKVK
jgi:hypothetical protein